MNCSNETFIPFRYRGYYLDTETGLYYLMSRYYDPVTHRFINADGYFQSGGDVLDANMSAYCRNNPIMCIDSNGDTVYTIGLSGFACAGLDAYVSIYYACDDKGNSGLFWSIIDYQESGGLGLLSASATITSSVIWDADTIDDLYNNYSNWGFSVGEGFTAGLDLIALDNSDTLSGISLSVGLGAGLDFVHAYNTTTKSIFTNYSNSATQSSTNKSTSKTTTKKSTTSTTKKTSTTQIYCRGCGRPIGKQYAWQCSSPSYY